MNFNFSPEQEAFRAEVRRLAAAELAPSYAEDDRLGRFRRAAVARLAALGLLGMRIPDAYGGQDADFVTTGLALEELAYADINIGYAVILANLVGELIRAGGTAEQHARFLPAIATAERVACLALTEPDFGSDAAHLRLKAERDGAGWRLTGEKTSISLGMYADTVLVFARTSGEGARGVSAFYIELDDRHVQRGVIDDLGARSIGRATLSFDGHPVPASSLIGCEGDGFVRVMQGFDFSRALIALMCCGCAQASLDEAWQWCRDRVVMRHPIGTYQGVSFPLVEHQTLLHAARLLAYEALWRKDSGLPHATEASMAKWWAPRVAVGAAHQALLTIGHVGYSSETPHGQRIRDLIGWEIADGTAQIAQLVAARHILGRAYAP